MKIYNVITTKKSCGLRCSSEVISCQSKETAQKEFEKKVNEELDNSMLGDDLTEEELDEMSIEEKVEAAKDYYDKVVLKEDKFIFEEDETSVKIVETELI